MKHPDSTPIFVPTFRIENSVRRKGVRFIAGVDEVGRGCLAGSVVAAAVIFSMSEAPTGVNDSKRLSPARREALDIEIRAQALAFSIGEASVDEIDTINILQASRLAMRRAVESLSTPPEFLLIDGNVAIDSRVPQLTVIAGDQKSVSIAAASIIAKVFRDQMMREMDAVYPGYEFAAHKGYASPRHKELLAKNGPCTIHRRSFGCWESREPIRASSSEPLSSKFLQDT